MPIGNEIASFTSNITSMTKSTDSAGNHTFVMNVEGEVSGGWSGPVVGTITGTTQDFQTGTYTADYAVYLTDGSVVTGVGSGTFGSTGNHAWQVNGTTKASDGSRAASEGTLELASRSYNGKLMSIE